MCQLQIILNTRGDKLTQQDYLEFEKLMCFGSMKNKDAWGVFNSSYAYKEGGVFKPCNLNKSKILADNFIVGHNRLATTMWEEYDWDNKEKLDWSPKGLFKTMFVPKWLKGNTKKIKQKMENINHHPFELKNFLLVHNGVINNAPDIKKKYNINTPIKTDSYVILWLINRYFNLSKKKGRINRISDAISKTTKEISGWYSVFLLDKKDKNLFYFKDSASSFTLFKINNLLVGSTEELNLDYVYSGEKGFKLDIKDNKIYLLKGSIPKIVGEFDGDFIWDYSEEDKIKDEFIDRLGFAPDFFIKGELVYVKDNKRLKKSKLKKYFKFETKKGLFGIKFIINKPDIIKEVSKNTNNGGQ